MNEMKRLEMLNKHYEEKETKLIAWLKEEIKLSKEEEKRNKDNYNLKMNWTFYKGALKNVLKEIDKLERVD